MSSVAVFVEGLGVLGPGLTGWSAARPVLLGEAPYVESEIVLPPVARLPPAERRRTGAVIRLAIAAGLEALDHAGRDPAEMATVFTASGGDGETIDAILSVLASGQREISPTRFHNSVHNAPSGYWSLACAAMAPSTSLCGFDASFATGLLDAAAQALACDRPVTVIAYDVPYPEPLRSARPMTAPFAAALVLTPGRTDRSLARISLRLEPSNLPGTGCADPLLEVLRRGNPAARALPLLACLAGAGGDIRLDGIAGASLHVGVGPA